MLTVILTISTCLIFLEFLHARAEKWLSPIQHPGNTFYQPQCENKVVKGLAHDTPYFKHVS